MSRTLDIVPLRSFVAVADAGGFQRAADVLHLSQGAVSQHVRRLESAIGRPLVERRGRGCRFTADGEQLLTQARRLLALHDEVLVGFYDGAPKTVIVGSTEHAAAQLLPCVVDTFGRSLAGYRARFRIDRGTRLRESFAAGQIDVALLLGPADDPRAAAVGDLELSWFCSPGWMPPAVGEPVPLVAFSNPCALRSRALETLARHSIPVVIGAEAHQLAGVQAAVMAGLGVALMATLGQPPEGMVALASLPRPEPIPLAVWSRQGLNATVSDSISDALRRLLGVRELAELPGHRHGPLVRRIERHLNERTVAPSDRTRLQRYTRDPSSRSTFGRMSRSWWYSSMWVQGSWAPCLNRMSCDRMM